MTITPFPKYKKPITEILNYYQWNQSFHNLLKLHFTTVWHEVFTRVYFREFSEFSGDSGKLNHAKMISCEKKISRQFTSFLYRNEVQLNWLQTISKPSFWQFKPNLKCLRSLCKFITLEKTIYWKTRHTWPRYMKTAWTCPVSMQTDPWWDEILKGIRDATFMPSIKNDGRVDVQVDEQIEQPIRDSLTHQGNPHVQNVKKIWHPLLLSLYVPVQKVKYRTETCLKSNSKI